MGIDKVNKAVFLDRDGVINEMFCDKETGEYRPPHSINEVRFIENSFKAIRILNKHQYLVFVVSNQPDYAKGKTDIQNINEVIEYIKNQLSQNSCFVNKHFYCFHHPEGILDGYNIKCECRKPGTMFVDNAVKEYSVNRKKSFFIGDRVTDIQCGVKSGMKTIFIENKIYKMDDSLLPDYTAHDLISAVNKILNTYE